MREIVQRTADAMADEGTPFQGVLFAGLMVKDGKVSCFFANHRGSCTESSSPSARRAHAPQA